MMGQEPDNYILLVSWISEELWSLIFQGALILKQPTMLCNPVTTLYVQYIPYYWYCTFNVIFKLKNLH